MQINLSPLSLSLSFSLSNLHMKQTDGGFQFNLISYRNFKYLWTGHL